MDNQKIIHPFFIGKGSREGRKVSREGRKEQRRLWTTSGDTDHKFFNGSDLPSRKNIFIHPGFFCLAAFLVFTDPSSTDQKPFLLKDQKY